MQELLSHPAMKDRLVISEETFNRPFNSASETFKMFAKPMKSGCRGFSARMSCDSGKIADLLEKSCSQVTTIFDLNLFALLLTNYKDNYRDGETVRMR
jgi:hypothetical protein